MDLTSLNSESMYRHFGLRRFLNAGNHSCWEREDSQTKLNIIGKAEEKGGGGGTRSAILKGRIPLPEDAFRLEGPLRNPTPYFLGMRGGGLKIPQLRSDSDKRDPSLIGRLYPHIFAVT